MKKRLLVLTAMVLALGITACSSDKEQTTTSAETETTVDEVAWEAEGDIDNGPGMTLESEEEVIDMDQEYISGTVTAIDGTILTLKDSEGKESSYDIKYAEVYSEYGVGIGDEIDLGYYVDPSAEAQRATDISVFFSVVGEAAGEEEPVASGVIESYKDGKLVLKNSEDDMSYEFSAADAIVVSKDGVKEGVEADIIYLGDLAEVGTAEEELPLVVKIVTADAADEADASSNLIAGTVVTVEGDTMDLEALGGNTFNFYTDGSADFSSLKAGDKVTVLYDGTLSNKEIMALEIRK